MAQMTMIQAITDALAVELKRDENVLIFGKTLVKTVGFSVQLKGFKMNSVKTACSTLL